MLLPIVASSRDVALEEVDIESDDRLFARFLERIPVIELDDRIIGELEPDPSALRAVLLHTSAR